MGFANNAKNIDNNLPHPLMLDYYCMLVSLLPAYAAEDRAETVLKFLFCITGFYI